MKRLIIHNFSYILRLDCIYYENNLRNSILYYVDSEAIYFDWRTIISTQSYTCPYKEL
jgi:hypothetical protein